MRKDREVGREQRREEGQGALRGSPVRVGGGPTDFALEYDSQPSGMSEESVASLTPRAHEDKG